MKKNIIGAIPLMLTIALALCGCGKPKDNTDGYQTKKDGTINESTTKDTTDTRRAILSLADLMIDKLTISKAPKDAAMLAKILELREYDSKFYKALYYEKDKVSKEDLPKKYFYSRIGSCCPCSGGQSCCKCSGATTYGVPTSVGTYVTKIKGDQKSKFMLASVAPQRTDGRHKLIMDKDENMDGLDIFKISEKNPTGNYFVTFKGKLIDLTLLIDIDDKREIEIKIEK